MARSAKASKSASARDVADIERLLRELEGKLGHLSSSVAADGKAAVSAVPDMITEAFSELADRVRQSTNGVRHEAEQCRRARRIAHRIEDEVAARPLATLAVAAGIGFLIGMLNRR